MWKRNDPTPCLLRLLSYHSLHVVRISLQKYSVLTVFGLSRPFTQTIPHAPHTTVSVNFFFRRDCVSIRGLGLSVLYQPLSLSFSSWMGVSSSVKMLLKFPLSASGKTASILLTASTATPRQWRRRWIRSPMFISSCRRCILTR